MERHLAHMAEKGWMLERISSFGWHYRKIEPKNLHFTVSYYPKASAFEAETCEGQQIFQDFCQHAGWKLAACNAKLQVFYNEAVDPIPIHTESATELANIEKSIKWTLASYVLLLILGFLQIGMNLHTLLHDPIHFLSNPLSHFSVTVFLLLSIYLLLELITYAVWHRKALKAAETDEPLPFAHGHQWLLRFTLYFTVLGLLFCLVTTRQPVLLISLCSMVCVFLIVNGVRIFLKKKKVSTNKNRTITCLVDLILVVLLLAVTAFALLHFSPREDFMQDAVPKTPVTLAELIGDPTETYITDSYSSSSLFVSCSKYYDWSHNGMSLSYTIVDVHMPFLFDVCLQSMLHNWDKFGKNNPQCDVAQSYYVYQSVDASLWNADQAWQLYCCGNAENTYLLTTGNCITEVSFDTAWTPAQMALFGSKIAS